MNLNNWRNWHTNLMIRLGFRDQFAHAFVEQDYFVEDIEEEVSLAPTFLELKIGKNWWKPALWWGGSKKSTSPPPIDAEKIKADAVAKAKEEASKIAEKNKLAYETQQAEIQAMKDKAAATAAQRQDKLTTTASALKIGGARDTTGIKGSKAKRRKGTKGTVNPLDKKFNPAGSAGPGGGAYGGQPVL